MKTLLAQALVLLVWGTVGTASAQTVHLQFDASQPQVSHAAARLRATLREKGLRIGAKPTKDDFVVALSVNARDLEPEAFRTTGGERSLAVEGGDGRGVIYGALSIAEQLRNGTAIGQVRPESAKPALAFRAIKFNLPWDSYRSSSALDLHYDTVRDLKYWEAFLDMMADNRFNALTLWNLHPFPYMIKSKNFPEASRFTDAEMAEWRNLYRGIFSMAKERGIETYVVNWNVVVSPEFAKAHQLKGANFYPNYKGEADTSEVVKRYTRESVTQMLNEYPDLTGFGFSFGEQMGGMTPRERQEWVDDTLIAGVRAANRPSKMIFRAPFSADLGQGGSTDLATEQLTRNAIDRLDGADDSVWMEIKFNWSHGHSTPELVKVHGGEMKDTYFNPVPRNYKVAWMVRNEDFYTLRWGVADFVREHLRQNAHQAYVGGYFVGSENYIPAKDYFTATSAAVNWRYAFERQWLFYKLWGRLLYDPATPDRVFEDEFVRRYGESAKPLLKAYGLASATQLKFATATDFSWDFTIYGEGMMVLGRGGMQPMSLDRLILQKPLLKTWLSVQDFVGKRLSGEAVLPGTMTPLALADDLEADNLRALRLLEGIDTSGNASLMYEVADVKAWASLGLYYADKLRAAVALQTYRMKGGENHKQAAIAHAERSLAHWDELIAITRPIYKDMPLTHYNPPNNGRTEDNLFHWALLRPAIARDVEVAKAAAAPK
ncbi:hypothetical protein ABVV53_00740 [Novosphingobium sp. RD2P27]|uniref:Beta-hexosaminidase bacterial type N-terminal domain-containing protein n=1 Tax=Novosphingobium kalidii TaxID=3230299 RepID=A0ABV2CWL9_9SPHN